MDNLDAEFQKAIQKVANRKEKLPQDTMLRLYAYYKQATKGDNFSFNLNTDIKNGFKFNAWKQLKGLSIVAAKTEYITLVNTIFK